MRKRTTALKMRTETQKHEDRESEEATPPRTTSEVQEFDCAGSACRGADTPDWQCLSTKDNRDEKTDGTAAQRRMAACARLIMCRVKTRGWSLVVGVAMTEGRSPVAGEGNGG
jgi:hypothetical protein